MGIGERKDKGSIEFTWHHVNISLFGSWRGLSLGCPRLGANVICFGTRISAREGLFNSSALCEPQDGVQGAAWVATLASCSIPVSPEPPPGTLAGTALASERAINLPGGSPPGHHCCRTSGPAWLCPISSPWQPPRGPLAALQLLHGASLSTVPWLSLHLGSC